MENTVLAMALGKVSPTASDQELTERMTALRGLEDKIRETTGKSDPGAALAVIEGWREGAAKLTEAQGELAKVRDREEKTAYAALVSQGELSAQITPGNRAKVLERFPTSSSLSAYLETAPAALPGRATAAETQPKAPEGKPAEGGALTYQGKAWKDLKPAEQAALYQADRPLYDQMRGAAMAQNGGAR